MNDREKSTPARSKIRGRLISTCAKRRPYERNSSGSAAVKARREQAKVRQTPHGTRSSMTTRRPMHGSSSSVRCRHPRRDRVIAPQRGHGAEFIRGEPDIRHSSSTSEIHRTFTSSGRENARAVAMADSLHHRETQANQAPPKARKTLVKGKLTTPMTRRLQCRTSRFLEGSSYVIDAFARRIFGWRFSRTAHAGFVVDTLDWADHDVASVPRRPRTSQKMARNCLNWRA